MKSNRIQSIIQKALDNLYAVHPRVRDILKAIDQKGGTAYFVGGVVRDILLGQPIKDVDIEVHRLTEDELTGTLKKFGPVDLVGQAFGVLKLHGLDVDWSLPRADSAGRKPTVAIDPHMPIKEAFRRRDLTINAMGIDAKTGTLVDPFDGQKDLDKKVLRSPDIAFFAQDPLRFFRVMQFIARFGMKPDKALEDLCKKMDISTVSRERIEQEFAKMLLRSERPSLGIRWLRDIGRLKEILPELADTINIKQDYRWHPEGDVFEHSMQSLDAAAQLAYNNEQEKLVLLYAALCHDLGKVSTTTQDKEGPSTGLRTGIHSYGHAEAGEQLACNMLKHITHNKQLRDQVATLVRWHMVPIQLVESESKLNAYKRLASRLAPHTNIAMLAKLALADKRGRNPDGHEPLATTPSDIDAFLQRAEQARVKHQKEPALLTGKDFLDQIKPGPLLGRVVKKAYELQLEGVTDIKELKRSALQAIKNR